MTLDLIVDEATGEIKTFPEKVAPSMEHGETPERPERVGRVKKVRTGEEKMTLAVSAQRFIASYGANLAWQAGSFLAETSTGWTDVTDAIIRRAHKYTGKNAERDFLPIVRSFLKVPEATSCSHASIYYKRVAGADGDMLWEPFHLSRDEVMLTDGVYNILTDELTPFGSQVIYGPRISMPWLTANDEPLRCEEFEDMVERALPDAEIRRHFQEVMSLILQPHVVLRGQIILWGPPKSGKTTIATAIGCAAAGATGVSFIQEAELVKSKWSAAGLLNRFANLSDDSPVVDGWPGWVKSYTSGNLRLELKYQQPFRATATAKLISTCNELQDAADASGAMVDRMFPFRFANRVAGVQDTEKMTVEYWSHPDRREGIVNWLLDGLIRLRERGSLLAPESWEQEKQIAVNQADPLEAWLHDNLESDPEGSVSRAELMNRLPAELVPGRSLDMKLASYMMRLFKSEAERKRVEGERERFFTRVKWA